MLQWEYSLPQKDQTFSQKVKNVIILLPLSSSASSSPLSFFPHLKLYLRCLLNMDFICLFLDRVQGSCSWPGCKVCLRKAGQHLIPVIPRVCEDHTLAHTMCLALPLSRSEAMRSLTSVLEEDSSTACIF